MLQWSKSYAKVLALGLAVSWTSDSNAAQTDTDPDGKEYLHDLSTCCFTPDGLDPNATMRAFHRSVEEIISENNRQEAIERINSEDGAELRTTKYHDDFDDWWMYESENFVTYWYGKGRNVAETVVMFAELDNDATEELCDYPYARVVLDVTEDASGDRYVVTTDYIYNGGR